VVELVAAGFGEVDSAVVGFEVVDFAEVPQVFEWAALDLAEHHLGELGLAE
jgi:hypothetical protein